MKRLLLMLVIFISFLLAACGGLTRIDRLTTRDFFTNDVLVIPMGFRYGSPQGESASGFATNLSAAELRDLISNQSTNDITYSAQEYPNEKLLIQIKDSLKERIVIMTRERSVEILMKREHPDLDYFYRFFNMAAQLDTISERFIFPYHLVEDARISNDLDVIVANERYTTHHTIDDYVNFYRVLVATYSDISVSDSDIEVGENNIRLSGAFVHDLDGNISHNKAVMISFDDDAQKRTISFRAVDL